MKFETGDIVHVRARVLAQSRSVGTAYLEMGGAGPGQKFNITIETSEIVNVEPRPIVVGDRVRVGISSGTVIARHDEWAWVMWEKCDDEKPTSVKVERLARA